MIFKNRQEAGQKLAIALKKFKDKKDILVLALPRGGVVVAYEVAKKLNLPLDLVVPRKIGAPENEEYAIGAMTEIGEGIFNQEAISALRIDQTYLDETIAKEKKEALRRLKLYRQNRGKLILRNKTVIIVDDGIATGLTMRAAIKSIKEREARKIIVAAPVVAIDSLNIIKNEANEGIYLEAPTYFGAVGEFYKEFDQTSDKEVIDLMEKSKNFGKNNN